ncbi:MAG: hypothetical protein QOG67_1933 [Verrucomicrobiota bacterium]
MGQGRMQSGEHRLPACSCQQPAGYIFEQLPARGKISRQAAEMNRLAAGAPQFENSCYPQSLW